VADQVKLKEDLLEPEFIDLMDDDEKHLIVTFFQRLKAPGVLAVQDLIKFDIVGIIQVFHRVSFRAERSDECISRSAVEVRFKPKSSFKSFVLRLHGTRREVRLPKV
jgi:hypothetical protein